MILGKKGGRNPRKEEENKRLDAEQAFYTAVFASESLVHESRHDIFLISPAKTRGSLLQ